MTLVRVTHISEEWEPNSNILIYYYHLSNGRKVSVMITKETTINLGSETLASVVTGMVEVINKQLSLKVPVGDQWNLFGDYIRDEFVTTVGQLLHLLNGSYPKLAKPVKEWGLLPPIGEIDDLAPHEERQPRVLHLIDLGDGMLVPKGFVEMILNDVPLAGVALYVDDFMKEKPDPEKYFKQIMKHALVDKGFYQSQYLQFPELEGPQPGPDKKYIPENHKLAPHNPFVLFKKKPTKIDVF